MKVIKEKIPLINKVFIKFLKINGAYAKYCNYVKTPIIEFHTINSKSYISGFFNWPINELDFWHTLHCKWIKIIKIMNEYEKKMFFERLTEYVN